MSKTNKYNEIDKVSTYFNIDEKDLEKLDILNATLSKDTNLFINPLKLQFSQHKEMKLANENFLTYFSNIIPNIINYIEGEKDLEDIKKLKTNIIEKLKFKEVHGIALGYSSNNSKGKGIGKKQAKSLLHNIDKYLDKKTIAPEIFRFIPMIGEQIGGDKISDMTIFIILEDLINFNIRTIEKLRKKYNNLILIEENFFLNNKTITCKLLKYKSSRCILVPMDILSKLPQGQIRGLKNFYWNFFIDNLMSSNKSFRKAVNYYIFSKNITKKRDRVKAKNSYVQQELKKDLVSKEFENVKELIFNNVKNTQEISKLNYDFNDDTEGFNVDYEKIINSLIQGKNIKINKSDNIQIIVENIIKSFKEDIERNKELYNSKLKNKKRDVIKNLFFMYSQKYSKENNLNITINIDNRGIVYFNCVNNSNKIIVAISFSNMKVVATYDKKLEKYLKEEEANFAYYVVLDVGGSMENKLQLLSDIDNARQNKVFKYFVVDTIN